MKSLNRVELLGYLGKAPLLETTNNATKICRCSIATDASYKNQQGQIVKQTDWNYLTLWGKNAEMLCRYAGKGTMVYVEAKIATREYTTNNEKKFTTDITVKSFFILTPLQRPTDQATDQATDQDINQQPIFNPQTI